MAGYSATPLSKKLGIREGDAILAVNAPANYRDLLDPLPPDVQFVSRLARSTAMIHLFTTDAADLATKLGALRRRMAKDAALWVSWPKKSAKLPTDVTEDVIRDLALPIGLVDVKVCAVDEVWSGLKLVIRRELR